MAKRLQLKREGEGTRRRETNHNAHRLVSLAMQKGHSYEDIGRICDVSAGSVKRWLATGRADAEAIRPLVEMIGHVYLKPDVVADILVDVYGKRRRRFRLKRSQLKKISGRAVFRGVFLEALAEGLLSRNFHFIEESNGEEDFFVLIRRSQLRRMVPGYLEDSEISQYYQDISEEGQVEED